MEAFLRRSFLILLCAVGCIAWHTPGAAAAGDWDRDWTAVTMARDGSWGVGVDPRLAAATAIAVRECKAMSATGSDCGAEVATARDGWIVGVRCNDYRILAKADTLRDAEFAALYREIDLKELYVPDLPACERVLTVDPRGVVTTTTSRFSRRH